MYLKYVIVGFLIFCNCSKEISFEAETQWEVVTDEENSFKPMHGATVNGITYILIMDKLELFQTYLGSKQKYKIKGKVLGKKYNGVRYNLKPNERLLLVIEKSP